MRESKSIAYNVIPCSGINVFKLDIEFAHLVGDGCPGFNNSEIRTSLIMMTLSCLNFVPIS